MDTAANPESGIARPRLSYAAIAEQLLARRLAQPDLAAAGGNDKTALSHAFRRLAPVFALDHAAAAGEPPRAIIAVLAAGLVEALQAGTCRLLLKSASGELTPLGNDGDADNRSGGLAAQVAADGRARSSGEPSANLACAALARQDGEIVGVLVLFDKRSGPFDGDDLGLAAGVGAYIAELAVTAGLLPWLAQGVRVVPRPAPRVGERRRAGKGRDPFAHPGDRAGNPGRRPRLDPALRPDDGRTLHGALRGIWASANCASARMTASPAPPSGPASSPTSPSPTRIRASILPSTGRSAIARATSYVRRSSRPTASGWACCRSSTSSTALSTRPTRATSARSPRRWA